MPEIFHSVGKVQSFGTDLDFSFFFFGADSKYLQSVS